MSLTNITIKETGAILHFNQMDDVKIIIKALENMDLKKLDTCYQMRAERMKKDFNKYMNLGGK